MEYRQLGAQLQPDGSCTFTVWAPDKKEVRVELTEPEVRTQKLEQDESGYWSGTVNHVTGGARYVFQLENDRRLPDPASQWQPDGVHEASAVVDHHRFSWTDQNWQPIPLEQMIIYELHIGTFTPEGTFEAAINKLPYLLELGVNTIEIMPVAAFPGSRNWGYDGVFPFAAQHSYGGPEGLKKLVDACHAQGLAVVLDVVYNHLGPEGNYLGEFGPYFTDKYHTPWGKALNFDDAYSDGVRNYFIQNALMWLRDYHIDGLRLDAVHAIMDMGAKHILQELADQVRELEQQTSRSYVLIAESDLNDVRVVLPKDKGGFGIDGQWSDDFHHALHSLVTGEQDGYYSDFGELEQLQQAFERPFVYNGRYSRHRHKTFGNDATGLPGSQFVVCSQNHDQVGNRMLGERLTKLVSEEMLKVVAATVLLSPYVPMLFMGEEYGEENPFLYFVSHTDKDLVEAVRKGRKEEFKAFAWAGEAPDPQAEETFQQSKLSWQHRDGGTHEALWQFYRQLIQLRKTQPALRSLSKENLKVTAGESPKNLLVTREAEGQKLLICYNYSAEPATVSAVTGSWRSILRSNPEAPETLQQNQQATLPPESVTVYENA